MEENTILTRARAAGRLYWLDALRGFSVLSMIGYHTMYDWVYVFGHSCWFNTGSGLYWQHSIGIAFVAISGFSLRLGKKPLKNALLVGGCAVLLTLLTNLFMPSEAINFGVLHFMAAAMLLTLLLRPVLDWINTKIGAAACILLFFLCQQIPWHGLGYTRWRLCDLPAALYAHPGFAWLGFQSEGFFSSDYYPLLPWIFAFWAGYFLCDWYFSHAHAPAEAPRQPLRALAWVGRHSLPVYMLHQLPIMALLWGITTLMG